MVAMSFWCFYDCPRLSSGSFGLDFEPMKTEEKSCMMAEAEG